MLSHPSACEYSPSVVLYPPSTCEYSPRAALNMPSICAPILTLSTFIGYLPPAYTKTSLFISWLLSNDRTTLNVLFSTSKLLETYCVILLFEIFKYMS